MVQANVSQLKYLSDLTPELSNMLQSTSMRTDDGLFRLGRTGIAAICAECPFAHKQRYKINALHEKIREKLEEQGHSTFSINPSFIDVEGVEIEKAGAIQELVDYAFAVAERHATTNSCEGAALVYRGVNKLVECGFTWQEYSK